MRLTEYTIDSIEDFDFTITFVFDDNSISIQTIHFDNISTIEALDEAVRAYAVSYLLGLEKKQSPEVLALRQELNQLIGQSQKVTVSEISLGEAIDA